MDDNENKNINLKGDYKSLSVCIKHNGDYLKEYLEQTQKISQNIKSIRIEDPDTYEYTKIKNKEYTLLLERAKLRIETIVEKYILYAGNKGDFKPTEKPDVKK
jgi:hypothetical protein